VSQRRKVLFHRSFIRVDFFPELWIVGEEVANVCAAAIAETVGVVGWAGVAYAGGGADVCVAYVVGLWMNVLGVRCEDVSA
jgi:hypothetical protein